VEQVDLTNCRRLLDVGAGPACYIIETLRAVPDATATAVDLPSVVDYTQACVEAAGLTGRVQVTAADMRTDELPTGYDTVFANNLFHTWDTESRAAGLAQCLRALDSGGTLYVCEHMRESDPSDRDGPEVAAVASLLLLLQTGQGTSYTTTDFADAVSAAGFVDVQVTPFPGQAAVSHILSARKP
jgi:cyclopropane fatty-acyl-phospholipid synthase-like methyltransferase